MIHNVGLSAAAADAEPVGAAASGEDTKAEAKEEAKKEESEESSDEDMGFGTRVLLCFLCAKVIMRCALFHRSLWVKWKNSRCPVTAHPVFLLFCTLCITKQLLYNRRAFNLNLIISNST